MARVNTGAGWTGTPAQGEFYVPAGGQQGDHLVKTSPNDGAFNWVTVPPVPPGSMEGTWRWQAEPVTADLEHGIVGVDTDNPRTATLLTVSIFDVEGNDRTAVFEGIDVDDTITFTVVDLSQSWHRYRATEPSTADPPHCYYIPVTTVDGSATGTEPVTGTELVLVVDRTASGGTTGSGTATSYVYSQPTAASVWTINHNLGFNPNVTVVDSTGREIWPGDIAYVSVNTVELTFSAAVGGESYLS